MLSLGFSPCPNDTFIFHALTHRAVDLRGYDFSVVIDDVEGLNRRASARALNIAKVSCAAYVRFSDQYRFLQSGGAFGRGCGPLVIAREHAGADFLNNRTVAIPGELTTAFLLIRLFCSAAGVEAAGFVPMVFHEIMPAVAAGRVDAGVIIHEGRFTYQNHGLRCLIDLGLWWEEATGLPVPLGGIIAEKNLGEHVISDAEQIIRESVRYAFAHPEAAMPYIRDHAQELAEDVIRRHIALYVNDFTISIGPEGRAALDELVQRAAAARF
ncbi:MAG: hypothetical protein FD164_1523 [Nitrospirae bacterium]|nr:MAG: hypothetical protein FD164_1523 [Nitrospirota bacterium]HSW38439.1 1,4-dihydroxy-6-naphthoate synthase [Acidobacteriota bacterium]